MHKNGFKGFVAGLFAMLPAPAFAGAWIAPDGGQSIFTLVYGDGENERYSQSDLYVEYPIQERWSVVAHPRFETGAATENGLRGDAELGAKAALARGDNATAAVQGAMLWRSDPELGCGQGGGEVRMLAGLGGSVSGGSGFLNAEAAVRGFDGGCVRQRYELTAGFRPTERLLTMSQTFVDADPDGEAIIRTQASVVGFFGGHGLQLGVRVRLDGEEREPALVLGLWDAVRP